MSDSYENMLYQEVLTRLKSVEKENARLRDYIAGLSAVVRDLERAFKVDSESTTKHVVGLNSALCDIYDYLFPVVRKIFPGWVDDKKRLDALLKKPAQLPPE